MEERGIGADFASRSEHRRRSSLGQLHTASGTHVLHTDIYRVSHLVVDLGWVAFDLGVPPSSLAAWPILPNCHQPRQNLAESGTLKILVDPSQSMYRATGQDVAQEMEIN